MEKIVVQNLCKEFKIKTAKVIALENLNLKVETGEIFGIVGTSGSGKSTLLYLIGGLLKPTSGQVLVNNEILYDKDQNGLNEYRAIHIGFVFQMFYLMSHLNSIENVLLPMQLIKDSKQNKLKRAKALLDSVGMMDRAYSKPSQLSGGEQQRIAIARALANNPDIILADEPTGNLDEKSEQNVIEIFKQLKSQNKTIIIVTHNKELVKHCDNMIEFKKIKDVSK